MSLAGRIGVFFLFIGLIGLVVFFATAQTSTPSYALCCSSWVLLFLGGFALKRNHNPQEPKRFSLLHRITDKKKKEKGQ
jgi:hypothetical protein